MPRARSQSRTMSAAYSRRSKSIKLAVHWLNMLAGFSGGRNGDNRRASLRQLARRSSVQRAIIKIFIVKQVTRIDQIYCCSTASRVHRTCFRNLPPVAFVSFPHRGPESSRLRPFITRVSSVPDRKENRSRYQQHPGAAEAARRLLLSSRKCCAQLRQLSEMRGTASNRSTSARSRV